MAGKSQNEEGFSPRLSVGGLVGVRREEGGKSAKE